MINVALVRGKFINKSEIMNYEQMDGVDITLIGARGTGYDGPLKYKTYPSTSMVPISFLRKGTRVLAGLLTGTDTYLYRMTEDLKGYDIIHVAETYHGFSLQAIEAKSRYDCSVVSTVWENIPYYSENGHYSRDIKKRLVSPKAGRIKAKVREEADVFLPVTSQAKFALETEGVESSKITQIPMGVNTRLFYPRQLEDSSWEVSNYGLDQNRVNVVFVGRTPWQKGIYDLLSAWRSVEQNIDKQIHLSIIGAEDNIEAIRDYARRINLSEYSINRPIPYKKIPLVMNAADILVLPSLPSRGWQEQYGRVIPESQACGTAIIGSDTGGIPEAAGHIGEFVRPGDAKDISKKIIHLINDSEKRTKLSTEGRERILADLTVDEIQHRITDVYKEHI